MSAGRYAVVPMSVLGDGSLSDGAARLYGVLLGLRPERDGSVIATHRQLAELCGHRRQWAVVKVAELAEAGLLEWRRGGRDRPNRYLPLEVVPRSRPLPTAALPGGAVGVEPGVQVLAVAAEPAAEREHIERVVDAEPGDGAGVGAARAASGPADAHGGDGGDRVRVACHDAEVTSGYGGWGWSP